MIDSNQKEDEILKMLLWLLKPETFSLPIRFIGALGMKMKGIVHIPIMKSD
jgi:hypothetical protein